MPSLEHFGLTSPFFSFFQIPYEAPDMPSEQNGTGPGGGDAASRGLVMDKHAGIHHDTNEIRGPVYPVDRQHQVGRLKGLYCIEDTLGDFWDTQGPLS